MFKQEISEMIIKVDITINKIHVIVVIVIAKTHYLCYMKSFYLNDSSNDGAFGPLLSLFCTKEDLFWRFSLGDL